MKMGVYIKHIQKKLTLVIVELEERFFFDRDVAVPATERNAVHVFLSKLFVWM